jgi:hypothetical protein
MDKLHAEIARHFIGLIGVNGEDMVKSLPVWRWASDFAQIFIFCRQNTAFDAINFAIFEKQGDAASGGFATAFLQAERVIPTFAMENIGQQWRAKNKARLIFRHPRLDLCHHLLRDEVTLLNGDAVRREKPKKFLR